MPEERDRENAPCRGCEKRKTGCHARCDDYKAFRARHDEYNAKVRKAKTADAEVRAAEIAAKSRMTRRLNKWKKRGWTR